MIVIDASVWVVIALPDDGLHVQSRQWVEQWERTGRPIAVPAIFPVEVGAALIRRVRKEEDAYEVVDDLLNDPLLTLLPIDREMCNRATRLAMDLRLRGADAIYVALAESLEVPLVTWDDQQRLRASERVATATPAQELERLA